MSESDNIVDLAAHRAQIEATKPAPVTCANHYAEEPEAPTGPTRSRLQTAVDLRGVDPTTLTSEWVGWRAIDILPDPKRAARGERPPLRAQPGPVLEPIDESRLSEILAGALPTEGEAATLSDALDGWPRGYFQKPPVPKLENVFICGPDPEQACTCGAPATLLCDAITGSSDSLYGTCDAPLCAACAREVAPDEHRCPAHRDTRNTEASESPTIPRMLNAPWTLPR